TSGWPPRRAAAARADHALDIALIPVTMWARLDASRRGILAMPKSHSRKKIRDRGLHAHWDGVDDGVFRQLGISREVLKAAQLKFQGEFILPGQPHYNEERMLANPVFNPMPSLIAVCATEADVAIALALIDVNGIPFTVRAGGHCTAGFSAGFGVLIDIGRLNQIDVNPATLTATVGAGTRFSALNQMLDNNSVHVPGGECEDVAIGGYVQGGGLGFTSTTYGMNCDSVLSMRVMLADGSIVIASETENYDLWWAMRGGTGGNFGVLLSVTYKLQAMAEVTGIALAWPLQNAADIARATDVLMLLQQKYMTPTGTGERLTLQVLLVYQTILDPKQPPLNQAVPVMMVRGLWVGDEDSGVEAMQPLMDMPGCVTQFVLEDRYPKVLEVLLDEPQDQPITPQGQPFEDKASRYVARDLTPAEWTSLLRYFVTNPPNQMVYMYLEFYGGAIARYPVDGSAFIHRGVHFNAVHDVFWYLPADRKANEDYLNGWIQLIQTLWNNGVYQNYASINVPDYAQNYWGPALPGLVKVKNKYDPGCRFTFPQQVPTQPAQGAIPAALAKALAAPIDRVGGTPPPR
ncbi:MAG: FAD-binding oxidoreductase, partial [Pseudomonadota bacterium]